MKWIALITLCIVIAVLMLGCARKPQTNSSKGLSFPAPACSPDQLTTLVGSYDFSGNLDEFV